MPGYTWPNMLERTLPALGDISAVTGARSIVTAFEWANMRGASGRRSQAMPDK